MPSTILLHWEAMKFGIDRLLEEPALRKPLAGRRLALLAHPASVTRDLVSLTGRAGERSRTFSWLQPSALSTDSAATSKTT